MVLSSYYRDFLYLALMEILQSELDNVRRMWNTRFIKISVTGIPNELFIYKMPVASLRV